MSARRSKKGSPRKKTTRKSKAASEIPKADGAFTLAGARDDTKPVLKGERIRPRGALIPRAARDGAPQASIEVAANDVVEVEFDSGLRLWMHGDELRKKLEGSTTRSGDGDGALEIPGQLSMLPEGMQARGPVAWAIKALKVLGVDLAGETVKTIAETLDSRRGEGAEKKRRPGPGLWRCSMETGAFALDSPTVSDRPADDAYLLFIHGTASSTWGSFGDLWSKERRSELEMLRAAYDDRVLAFEHPTLTQSPIRNALDLVKELKRLLPPRASVHLVTHSRGGMVGELLCRTRVARRGEPQDSETDGPPFSEGEFDLFKENEDRRDHHRDLRELHAELRSSGGPSIQVERFVRVACPAWGTTLASGRLDRWLSAIGSVASAALPGTPLSDVFKDIGEFLGAAVSKRSGAKDLPGLEAMMPESPVLALVNWPKISVRGDLFVISGDIEPDAWWAKLLVWVSDRFYEGDHDLVVNTCSMYGGASREGQALVSFHRGPDVHHFRYFRNHPSAHQVTAGLLAKGDDRPPGFQPLVLRTTPIPREAPLPDDGARPVVFVLPGIMGSELAVKDDRLWVDIPDLMFGGMKKLRIDALGIEAVGMIERYYGALIAHLRRSHEVVPFPFDWRLPIEDEADRLAEAVKIAHEKSERHEQPMRLLAHSMGGLVARAMIARRPGLWRDVCAHPGARLVMLGTPNGGSHAITELLVGQSSTLRKLAILDVTQDKSSLLETISRFPGMLAMLPKDSREDFFSDATWAAYHQAAGKGWIRPERKDLDRARELRDLLDRAPSDPEHTVYVAGRADVTVAEMFLERREGKEIKFRATARGDGRVTWDSGIPPGVPTWYLEAEHGDLPACESAFGAFQSLLEQGTTDELSQEPPVTRAAELLFDKPPEAEELYPSAEVLLADALGGRASRQPPRPESTPRVKIEVCHGNLAFATCPVMVGHYVGDTIVSAERSLDEALDGTLSQRNQLGIYPGAIETSAVFMNPRRAENPKARPAGAIVVGLGTVGSLTTARLIRSLTRALLEYALACDGGRSQRTTPTDFEVSSLLIGTGTGGVSVSDAVFALARAALDANQALQESDPDRRMGRLTRIEIIELWEDRAIQALRALHQLAEHAPLRDLILPEAELSTRRKGGRVRIRFEEPSGWWQRLQILGNAGPDGAPEDTLRFSASTDRASRTVHGLTTQRSLVDAFLRRSITTTHHSAASARTLFELLLPNELKEQAPDQDDLVLVLDEVAARYPWELLEDRWSESGRPLVVEHGMLRQLETSETRESITGTTETVALVVGDPVSKFPELPGAKHEAEAVARVISSLGLEVRSLLRPDGHQVVSALYNRAYRIVHLAGHGVYRYAFKAAKTCRTCGQPLSEANLSCDHHKDYRVTGMILGDDMVLSPREVQQMRRVPELVFINCCHLGRIEGESPEDRKKLNRRDDYNRIAANVATQFIRNGVRAVVAAGWAVDDRAAATFATTFYERILAGDPFGSATKAARVATHEGFPNSNTWGAYQCYGDPDFRLARHEGRAPGNSDEWKLASANEAVTEIRNIQARLETSADDEDAKRRLGESLESLVEALEKKWKGKKWLEEGELFGALGSAYGEAVGYEKAIRYYRRALGCERGRSSLTDLEQLFNMRVRFAVECKDLDVAGRLEKIDEAIQDFRDLIDKLSQSAGERSEDRPVMTVERRGLLGGAYKRRALVDPRHSKDALENMNKQYEEGARLAERRDRSPDPYPLLNQVVARLALAWQSPPKSERPQIMEDARAIVRKAQAAIEARLSKEPDFWSEAMRIDAQLLERLLLDKPLDTSDIASSYRDARKRSSPREFDSVLAQLDFLIAMAGAGRQRKLARQLQELRQDMGEAPIGE